MNPYPSYKESGIEWIGEIPSHWIKKRVRHILFGNFQNGVFKKKTEFGSGSKLVNVIDLYSVSNVVNQQSLDRVKVDENELKKYKVNEGDIFFVRSSLKLEGIGVSSIINEPNEQTVFECHIVRGIPEKSLIHPYYLKYIMNCDVVRRKIISISNTVTMTTISQNQINDIKLVLPPLSEQQEIINHLEEKTTKIDSLIEKTQRKIELLKEQRISLINQMVTKGLNPDVEMKDSGVEWIGEIPSGWKVGKLYQYGELLSGSTPSRSVPEYWDNGDIPWMSSGEVNKKIIRSIDGYITTLGHEKSNTPILPKKTIMIGLNGQGKTKGTVGILEIETTCNQSLCGIIFKRNIDPYFQYFYLESQYLNLRGLVGEGQREGISVSFLKRYGILIPPLQEQQQIVEHLDKGTTKIDSTIGKETQRIDLLKEYRQSLISEVVTGKIRITEDLL